MALRVEKSKKKAKKKPISINNGKNNVSGSMKGSVETPSASDHLCKNCHQEEKAMRRVFSVLAWTVLLLWNELSVSAVDQPICDTCYDDMRNILIDRAEEIEKAMEETQEVEKIQEKFGIKAS